MTLKRQPFSREKSEHKASFVWEQAKEARCQLICLVCPFRDRAGGEFSPWTLEQEAWSCRGSYLQGSETGSHFKNKTLSLMKVFMVWTSMASLRMAKSEVTLVLVYTGVGILGVAWEVKHSFPLDSVSLSRLISN